MKSNQQIDWETLSKYSVRTSASQSIPIGVDITRSRSASSASVALTSSVAFTSGSLLSEYPAPMPANSDSTNSHRMTITAVLPVDGRPVGGVDFRIVSTRPRSLSIPSRKHHMSEGLGTIGELIRIEFFNIVDSVH